MFERLVLDLIEEDRETHENAERIVGQTLVFLKATALSHTSDQRHRVVVERIAWENLPELTRQAVEKNTGPVHTVQPISKSLNSAVAAVLDTDAGEVFIKCLHRDYPRRWAQDMEEMINPYVRHLGLSLLWRVQGEWDILGFEYIGGRHTNPTPGSPDLLKVTDTITELGKIPCPDLPVKQAADRWRDYVNGSADLELLDVDRLLHTDYNPLNVLITEDRALLVDWAWSTRGAGWIDPAC